MEYDPTTSLSAMLQSDDMAIDTPTTNNTHMSFNSRFPAEIREQIFLMSILSHSSSPSSDETLPTPTQEPPLTRVCRLWRIESLPLYHKHHRYSVVAPLRLSGYGELYNATIDSQQKHVLPSAEALREVKKLRLEFLVDRFARGGDVWFRIDLDQLDGLSWRERREQSNSVKSRAGWIVRSAGVDARNTFDPREWRERAGMLVRYVEMVLEEEFGPCEGSNEGQWGEDWRRQGRGNVLTRDILRQFLCVDFREVTEGAGHPLWI